jgi:hypothetical protein
MKLFKKEVFILIFVSILFCNEKGFGQVTLYVTDTIMANSSGSLDSVLYIAKDSANIGRDVTVLFNAPGLCHISAQPPIINISDGSITMKKDPAATVEQGMLLPGAHYYNLAISSAIYINSNSDASSVIIRNLNIKQMFPKVGIIMNNARNVLIDSCVFEENNNSITIDNSSNITIERDSFSFYNTIGHNEITLAQYSNTDEKIVKIFDNYFSSNNNNSWAINIWNYTDTFNHKVEIKRNEILNYNEGISIINRTPNPFIADESFGLVISENNLTNYFNNLNLISPYKHFFIENNNLDVTAFSPYAYNIAIYQEYNVSAIHDTIGNSFGIDFINTNTIGYSAINSNNVITSNSNSFYIRGKFGLGNNIIGYDLPGKIYVDSAYNDSTSNRKSYFSFIRENRIISNSPPYRPIYLNTHGNYDIQKPFLSSCVITGTEVNVKYTLTGLDSINGDFTVDFYKSNSSGDLLDYIGSETIPLLTGSIYNSILTIPIGVSISNGDTVGATVSAFGNISTPLLPKGTSEVAYIRTKPYCCTTLRILNADTTICKDHSISLYFNRTGCSDSLRVDFGDGNDTLISAAVFTLSHTYATNGTYLISGIVTNDTAGTCTAIGDSITINVRDCNSPECIDCISSFAPIPGKKYLVSAWVKEDGAALSKTSYTYPSIIVSSPSVSFISSSFTPQGNIIDGWQRIESTFIIPIAATDLEIELNCSTGDCFFDDIRVLPFDGSLKSYVYDPLSMKLVAELDERNYATLYEYDEEGKLIRVKKETEKGIMTIKESRSVTKK